MLLANIMVLIFNMFVAKNIEILFLCLIYASYSDLCLRENRPNCHALFAWNTILHINFLRTVILVELSFNLPAIRLFVV